MKEKIEKYLCAHSACKITDIIAEFLVDFKTVIDILTELYEKRKVKQVGDNSIKYYASAREEAEEEPEISAGIGDAKTDSPVEETDDFENKKIALFSDLLMRNYNYDSNKEYEDKCMDVISEIAKLSPSNTRQDAIAISEELLQLAKGVVNKEAHHIFERVRNEFIIATDDEYELLRKQLFE